MIGKVKVEHATEVSASCPLCHEWRDEPDYYLIIPDTEDEDGPIYAECSDPEVANLIAKLLNER